MLGSCGLLVVIVRLFSWGILFFSLLLMLIWGCRRLCSVIWILCDMARVMYALGRIYIYIVCLFGGKDLNVCACADKPSTFKHTHVRCLVFSKVFLRTIDKLSDIAEM